MATRFRVAVAVKIDVAAIFGWLAVVIVLIAR